MRRLVFLVVVFCPVLAFTQNFNEHALIHNLKVLSADSMGGRRVGTTGSAMARDFVKRQFQKLKLEALGKDYELPFELNIRGEKKTGINLAGIVHSKGKSDKYIVISAHYDHEGVKGDKIYNGADDNASGVSTLFAIAEHFKKNKPNHNLIIVAFDAEEVGLQGARAFVKKPPVPIEKIVLNVNMDMVSRADKKALIACGTFYTPALKSLLLKVDEQDGIRLSFGHDDPQLFKGSHNWTQSSDHGPFYDAKIPFIYFGVDDHEDYHRPTDDFEKVNPSTFISCAKLIVRSVAELDNGLDSKVEF